MSLRTRIYNLFEIRGAEEVAARVLNVLLMFLILVNVLAVILETVEEYRIQYGMWFRYLEIGSVIVFTFEYMLRVWSCVENSSYGGGWWARLRYMRSPMAVVDLLAILPFFCSMLFSIDTRMLRVFRLFRVFKLSRHFSVLEVLGNVFRSEAKALLSAIFIMMILVVLSSAGMYVVERSTQPEVFSSIPRAMWWAVVTLTTVGYGDVVPVSLAGRLLGVVITILGVGMAALPGGILRSGFSGGLAAPRRAFENSAAKVGMGWGMTYHSQRQLIKIRNELGLERGEAKQLLKKVVLEHQLSEQGEEDVCPHCGKILH
ncbi:MAG: ion transporter [Desulfobulbaceae bacterium]|uniref:Ion transporter n=1 Tax=Candidatus Desulfobia pelagia TaxID=2841692 RepID=A0A8J6TF62_9BACT|nr:ion transporter [Candidatus Desulfobia pelagia]